MSWTTPFDWVTGMVPTVSQLNTIRDDLKWASGPRQSTLPTSPNDGDEFYFVADSTNGIEWRFKYNASDASAYKWHFIGGAAVTVLIETAETTVSGAYVDLATVGPSFTLPFAGDYEIMAGARQGNGTAGQPSYAALKRGATATSDNDIFGYVSGPAAAPGEVPTARTFVAASTSSGDVYKAQYKVGGGTGTFQNRWLRVQPRRVG